MYFTKTLIACCTLTAATLVSADRTRHVEATTHLLVPAQKMMQPASTSERLMLVPNQIVVRFADAATRSISEARSRRIGFTGLDSLDTIGFLLDVTKIEPQFKGASKAKASAIGAPDLSGFHVVEFNPELTTPEELCAVYRADPMVMSAEPIGVHRIYASVNDTYFSYQWHLDQSNDSDIDMPEAWDRETGSDQITVAILDTGVRYYHDDLGGQGASTLQNSRGNLWRNVAEDGGIPGFDDDGNGYIDDYLGWDFVSSPIYTCWSGEDCSGSDNDPRDFNGHGTHCAGIVGAINNNDYMVSSVAGGRGNGSLESGGNGVRLMSCKIGHSAQYGGSEYGFVNMNYAAQALYYAADNGARIASCSWGSSNSGGLGGAIDYFIASGGLVFKASGNSNSQSADYMGSRSDVINVAATDQSDQRASFSNYGSWIDISAPGVDILSTYHDHTNPEVDYAAFLSGTSMATPLAAGAAALIWSTDPSMPASEVWATLRDTADDIDSINGSAAGKLGSGRINVSAALASLGENSDPNGACCIDYGCSIRTQVECIQAGGTYFGDDSSCGQAECAPPDPTGACCLGNNCSLQTESDCTAQGGTYFGDDTGCVSGLCDPPPPANLLLMSFRGNTSVPGLGTVRNDDIVSYDPDTGSWSMYFDGSDVSFTSGAIDAFCILDDGSILLSKTSGITLDGVSFDDSDIVLFTPTSLGASTSGSFTMYFDASDMGLTTNGEDTDGISMLADGRLVLSTAGTTRISGIPTQRDEDLFVFTPTSLGENTSGVVESYLDNSDVGLNNSGGEDIDAFYIHPDGTVIFSCTGSFSVTGVSGEDEDLAIFTPGSIGSQTSGTFDSFIVGSSIGLPASSDIGGYCEVER
ncbi:MAG: S8 family serine peptidase [Planctomycetota bacterium]|nr:S8 family serine peptidase [Planctomycetota bacterium]